MDHLRVNSFDLYIQKCLIMTQHNTTEVASNN